MSESSVDYYNQGDIKYIAALESELSLEEFGAIKSALSPEEFGGFCRGNVLKHLWRASYESDEADLQKAAWYLARLIEGEESDEKSRRVYYQDIVYHVCNVLDRLYPSEKHVACGTVNSPTTNVQTMMDGVRVEIERLRRENEALKESLNTE